MVQIQQDWQGRSKWLQGKWTPVDIFWFRDVGRNLDICAFDSGSFTFIFHCLPSVVNVHFALQLCQRCCLLRFRALVVSDVWVPTHISSPIHRSMASESQTSLFIYPYLSIKIGKKMGFVTSVNLAKRSAARPPPTQRNLGISGDLWGCFVLFFLTSKHPKKTD